MNNKDFTPTGDRVCFWPDNGARRSQFDLRWADVFDVSEAAQKWDGTTAKLAIGSQFEGVYPYVWIDVTGRRETQVTGTNETGVRMKIYFERGTEDEVSGTGWIVRANQSTNQKGSENEKNK